jgi:hypothetical protein
MLDFALRSRAMVEMIEQWRRERDGIRELAREGYFPAVLRRKVRGPNVRKRADARRGAVGSERWRRVQRLMLGRLRRRRLPATLRDAARLLRVSRPTVKRAALESDRLRAHFGLLPAASVRGDKLLAELVAHADARQRARLARLPARERAETGALLAAMTPADRARLLDVLTRNPDAGRAGRCRLRAADSDRRRADCDHLAGAQV